MIPLAVYGESPWDKYTGANAFGPSKAPQWNQWMRSRPEVIVGWAPYQQCNIGSFPKLLIYLDAYAIYKNPDGTPNFPVDPLNKQPVSDCILHDDKGNLLFIPWGCNAGTCPQFAGDLRNPGFVRAQIQSIANLKQAGYQGIFIDDVNLQLDVGNGTGAIVAPSGVTPESWAWAMVDFVEKVRGTFPDLLIAHNSVWWDTAPEEAVNRQIVACNYYNMERGYGDPGLTPLQFAHQVQFVDRIHRYGRNVIQMEYSQNPNNTGPTGPTNGLTLQDKVNWFQTGYAPGDLMIVKDLFPDDAGTGWGVMNGEKP